MMDIPKHNGIEYLPFVVGDTPYCIWDVDLREANTRFLESIDPGYFEHLALTAGDEDDSLNKYVATSLRLGYSHALETLFGLLASLVQAPSCPLGWMLAYRNELVPLVTRIDRGDSSIRSMLKEKPTWNHLSRVVHGSAGDAELRGQLIDGFASVWRRFARDFISKAFSEEYNSLKHGMRSVLGGFSLAVSAEHEPGQAPPPDSFTQLGGSKHGTTFFCVNRLNARHFAISMQSLNWDPLSLSLRLQLAAMSIHNVVEALKQINGASRVTYRYPTPRDQDALARPWRGQPAVQNVRFTSGVTINDIADFSRDEILSVYDQSTDENHRPRIDTVDKPDDSED